jgi:hypothetical protein
VRLPINSLPYPLSIYEYACEVIEGQYYLTEREVQDPDCNRIKEFEFIDPVSRVSILIRKISADASSGDSDMLRIFEFDDIGTKIFLDMPVARFEKLSELRCSEREQKTGVCLKIEASVLDDTDWAPATVEYAWSDPQKIDRIS